MEKETTAQKLTDALRDHFCCIAVPDVLWSDGGPQLTSAKLSSFLATWGTSHIISSPHYPQSDGKAEATVKSMKKLISAAWKGRSINWETLSKNSLQYRNTQCQNDGLLPAKHLPVQDSLPAHHRLFTPEWQSSSEDADKKAETTHENAEPTSTRTIHWKSGCHTKTQMKLRDIYGKVTATASH